MPEPLLPTGAAFPTTRPRRVRQHAWLRSMVAETVLTPADLVWPLFVHDRPSAVPVAAMPGVERLSLEGVARAAAEAAALGIPAVALFPVVDAVHKSDDAAHAWDRENLACRAVRAIRRETGDSVGIVCDVALDPYTSHGHDGLLADGRIYMGNRDGQTFVIVPGTTFKLEATNPLDGQIMATPAAVGRAIYLRTDKALYRLEKKQSAAAVEPASGARGSAGRLTSLLPGRALAGAVIAGPAVAGQVTAGAPAAAPAPSP
jgi:porphobilinogen synthase